MKDLFVKQEWFGHVRQDVLAGILVALALIPEAIAFSIIAGVDLRSVYMLRFVLRL